MGEVKREGNIGDYFTLKKDVSKVNVNVDRCVILTFDDGYIDQALNMMFSVEKYNPESYYICVCSSLSEENIEKVLNSGLNVNVRLYEDKLVFDNRTWSRTTVYRLFLPWLLDEIIKRVLYFDCDMLCKGSLDELYSLDMGDKIFAICPELSENVEFISGMKKYYPDQIYCNAGTLVFNLEQAREKYSLSDVLNALQNSKYVLYFLDQDILNIFFRQDLLLINQYKYNFQVAELLGSEFYELAKRRAVVLHFSCYKPWRRSSKYAYAKLYYEYSVYPPIKKKAKKWMIKRIFFAPFSNAASFLRKIKRKVKR